MEITIISKQLILIIVLLWGAPLAISGTSDVRVDQITTVKVGLLTPQTGTLDKYSLGFEQAAQLAIDELNNDVTMNTSYNFELSIYNTGTDEVQAAIAMQDAVNDGMHYVAGPAASGNVLAAAPIAVSNQIPLIGYSSTSAAISTFDDHVNPLDHGYLWRTVSSDARHGHGMASLAFDGNFKNMAILSVEGWGTAIADIIETDFEKFGGSIVYSGSYVQDFGDFTSYIDDLLNANPDIITLPGFSDDIVNTLLELVSRDSIIPVISTNFANFDIFEDTEDAMQGMIAISSSIRDSEEGQRFREAYETKYSTNENGIFLENTYDAIYTGALAITTIGSTEGSDIISALSNLKFEGASGSIEFDENGDCVSAQYKLSEVRGDTFEPVAIWDNGEGLKYTDDGFMERWRTHSETIFIDTTITELTSSLPVSFIPIFFGIFVSCLVIVRRKRV